MRKFFPNVEAFVSSMTRFNNCERGQALIMTAVAVAVLMLMTGFGIEVGFLKYQKQQMQKAADAAALAGAATKIYGGDYQTAGKNDSSANGFTDGANGISVRVNYPPTEGVLAGQANFVEAIVSQPQPTFFMKVGGFNNVAVRARAVATTAGSGSGCIYVMDPSAASAYMAQGTITVNSACGLQVNSNNPNAYDDNGGACTNATGISIVGGIKNNSCSNPTPTTGGGRFSDPFPPSELPAPTGPWTCTTQNGHITGGTVTLYPNQGAFCGGIQIGGTSPVVTFSPGLYIIYGGGITINSSAQITATGVTFYNTGLSSGPDKFATISINGVSNSTFSAPTSGTYAGILFFEDRNASSLISNPQNTINGGSNTYFDGALYFLSSSLNYAGNSSSNGYSIIVADTLKITGTATLGDNYSSLPGGISPIHSAVIVE